MDLSRALFRAICISLVISAVHALEVRDLVITIFSQAEGYHDANADLLYKDIRAQAAAMGEEPPEVILTHKLNISGAWTIGPLLPHLSQKYSTAKWFVFCEENTVVKLKLLLELLSSFDDGQKSWVGHALYDHQPTIIHHYAERSKKFKYPNVASGFAMTRPLLNSVAQRISKGEGPENDFSIDASYEFATFVLDVDKAARLMHAPKFCIVSGVDCAIYPRDFHSCGEPLSREKVFVAVKTCSKYHVDRLSVINSTWARHATNIGYFTDKADENLPNAYIVPNTLQGHCAKTFGILKHADDILRHNNLDWLIISDDDTIFSLARLLSVLTCYNPANTVALGQRYGFRVWHSSRGYDYLTGGGGVVLSAPLVHRIIRSAKCNCPTASTPDDMFLFGICLNLIGVQPTHSPLFHQARPVDYSMAYLASQEPVSFHKFWMIDPESVYNEWFAEPDLIFTSDKMHTEL